DVEANDDRARRFGEQNVALRDRADAAVYDFDLHLSGGELGERIGERLRRAALVGLDENAQRALLAGGRLRHEIFERDSAARGAAALCLAVESLSPLSDISRGGGVLDDQKLVAGHRYPFDTEDLRRNGR